MDTAVAAALPSIRDAAADPMSVTFAPAEVGKTGVDPEHCAKHCRRRRLSRTDEAAGDVACGVHGAGRARARAGSYPSGHRSHRAHLHRGRRRRIGCAEHVVRRRYRCAHDAHRGTADPGRAAAGRRGSGFRPDARRFFRRRARASGQCRRGFLARAHHRLLRRRLYDVAQALDAAEHRHRRRRRRAAADHRLGVRDRAAFRSSRSCCFLSSSCGRRRISGL